MMSIHIVVNQEINECTPVESLYLTPLMLAGERSRRALSSLEGSTLLGPPLAYTPV